MSRIIHVAAGPVIIGTRVIQRCSACGDLLVDVHSQVTVVDGKMEVSKVTVWEPNTLVARTEMAGLVQFTGYKAEMSQDSEGIPIPLMPDEFCTKEEKPSGNDRPTQWKEVPPTDPPNAAEVPGPSSD